MAQEREELCMNGEMLEGAYQHKGLIAEESGIEKGTRSQEW